MSAPVVIRPLTAEGFAPFGDVLECSGAPDMVINQGQCGRYHDRAKLEFGEGRGGISIFRANLRSLPYTLDMMERHPLGSQAFVPMDDVGFLITVAPDETGRPGTPLAFQSARGQAINLHRNTWHGVLTPLEGNGLFAVVDRIGDDNNLEEFWFETPHIVVNGSN